MRKCPYCDFNSHPARAHMPEAEYLQALLDDLAHEAELVGQIEIGSIFFGGGTPSLFAARSIASLLEAVRRLFRLADDAEITLEANPGAFEADRFRGYRDAGVNRLSLGIQSLDDQMLHRLGRIHCADDAERAIIMARSAGFDNLNLDLMFGLPEQTPAMAIADLSAALRYGPEHLSWYQLTLEPNTAFAHSPPVLPNDEVCDAMHQAGIESLERAGLTRYEVSAFARDGAQCRHNLNYWRFGDYLGIGAGAHGKLTISGSVQRRSRTRHPDAFMRHAGSSAAIRETRQVSGDELLFEYLLNRLRLTRGFPASELADVTGYDLEMLQARLPRAFAQGLLIMDGGNCMTSETGFRFLDDILIQVLPENTASDAS